MGERANQVFNFSTRSAAWAFMRACDARGDMAGFPSTDGANSVRVMTSAGDMAALVAVAAGIESEHATH